MRWLPLGAHRVVVVGAAGSGPTSDTFGGRANGGLEDQNLSTPGDENDEEAMDEPASCNFLQTRVFKFY